MTRTEDHPGSQPSVRALERGLAILECFRIGETSLSLTHIAAKVDLTPSTTLRILNTLERLGYVVRDVSDKKYTLGPKSLELAQATLHSRGLRTLARPRLKALNAAYDESVTVYIPSGSQRICVDRIESSQPLRTAISIGNRLPINLGAAGKVLLAFAVETERTALQNAIPLPPVQVLDEVRRDGYAVSYGERAEGITAAAAPIFNASGEVIAALGMSGPSFRMTEDLLPDVIRALREAARDISSDMGWRGK